MRGLDQVIGLLWAYGANALALVIALALLLPPFSNYKNRFSLAATLLIIAIWPVFIVYFEVYFSGNYFLAASPGIAALSALLLHVYKTVVEKQFTKTHLFATIGVLLLSIWPAYLWTSSANYCFMGACA